MKPFLQENFLTSNHFQIITLNRFQLQGPQSIPILQTILLELKSESSDFFRSIYGHGVGEGSIIALDVYDPRLSFPPKMSKRNANPTPISLSNWPSNLVENAKIFDSESRCKALKSKKPDAYFKRRREKRLIPGKPLSPIETDHSLPILLVSSENGWDLIVPEGYGMVFWLSLVFCGAKIGGQRDIQIINFENQKRTFPYDYPCTPAYKEYIERLNTESELKWNRTPVAKRPNYPKLNTISPFVARFDEQSWILRTHEEIRQFLKGDPTLYEHALIPIQGILKKGIAPIASMVYFN